MTNALKDDFDLILSQLPEEWKEKEQFLENRLTNLDPVLQKVRYGVCRRIDYKFKSHLQSMFLNQISNFLQNFFTTNFYRQDE